MEKPNMVTPIQIYVPNRDGGISVVLMGANLSRYLVSNAFLEDLLIPASMRDRVVAAKSAFA